ncbi:unnamed protein product [Diplocarpon coronariae]
MEALLEILAAKISAYEEEEKAQRIMTPESIGNDVLTPFATAYQLCRRDTSTSRTATLQSTSSRTPPCRTPKNEGIHKTLITQADRYLALLLGLPAGSENPSYMSAETFGNPNINKDLLFSRKLCDLSKRIIDRNEAAHNHANASTQGIDEGLDSLAKEMPSSWWPILGMFSNDRSLEAALTFDKLMTQIWFFQLETLLHLPLMLKAERSYKYSKFSCLKASREMMWRYLALRSAENKSSCCKVVDMGALMATVTLFPDLLEPVVGQESPERKSDQNSIQTVLQSMDELFQGGEDVVTTQSASVIKSLLAVDDASGHKHGNLKLTIPHFGTISTSDLT